MACLSTQKVNLFKSLVPGCSGFTITNDVPPLVFVVELVMEISGKDKRRAAECLRLIPENIFPAEKFVIKKTPGSGNSHTKLLTFDDSIELIMVLPGKMAKEFRVQAVNILKRYMAGDLSLISEIQSNAKSQHPVAQMARQSLTGNKKQCIDTTTVQSNADNQVRIIRDAYSVYAEIVSNPRGSAVVKATYESFFLDMIDKFRTSTVPLLTPGHQLSYLYCTASPAFPDLVKIGRSKAPESRTSTLNTGCAPSPHELMATVPTLNDSRDEKLIHTHFKDRRDKGEFFRVTIDEVKQFFTTIILPMYIQESAILIGGGELTGITYDPAIVAEEETMLIEPILQQEPESSVESKFKDFLENSFDFGDTDSKLPTFEICDVFFRTIGMDSNTVNKRITDSISKIAKATLLGTDGCLGKDGCGVIRVDFPALLGLTRSMGYRGLSWKDDETLLGHITAVRATYSDTPRLTRWEVAKAALTASD